MYWFCNKCGDKGRIYDPCAPWWKPWKTMICPECHRSMNVSGTQKVVAEINPGDKLILFHHGSLSDERAEYIGKLVREWSGCPCLVLEYDTSLAVVKAEEA